MTVAYLIAELFEPAWAKRARDAFDRDPLNGWIGIDARAAAVFSVALNEQLPAGHRLSGTRWRAVGRVDCEDDIAFVASDGRCALVHLTWQKESDPRWPRAAIYSAVGEARAVLDGASN